jgi:serine protease Do
MLTPIRFSGRAAALLVAALLLPAAAQTPSAAAPVPEGFRLAAKRAAPAVVSVIASKTIRFSAEDLEPFWDLFGGLDLPREYRQRGIGSGVVVSSDGYILTNAHVVDQAASIRVLFADRREFKARLTGADTGTDVALLKIEAAGLPYLDLADSSIAQVGDIVLAIGNPFGIGETVTMGIVSALGRRGVVDPERYEDFIQTDAAINPGNSGGALITARGELIGINTAILTRSGGYQGIGFAIPSNVARHTMTQILKHGRVIRGWLGVSLQPVTAAVARAFGLKDPAGVLVSAVTPGSPAANAGIARGDIILELNGQRIADPADLRMKVASTAPQSSVTLRLFREGRERTVRVILGELPRQTAPAPPAEEEVPAAIDGVQLEQMTPRIARQLRLPANTTGVVVAEIEQDSPAAEAGLRLGDVIVEVDRKPATSVQEVERALKNRGSRPVVLLVNRSGETLYIVIETP